ncbi:MAG: beta-L-arabinofuranosidase domain-containing protein [Myxococcota bacterium]
MSRRRQAGVAILAAAGAVAVGAWVAREPRDRWDDGDHRPEAELEVPDAADAGIAAAVIARARARWTGAEPADALADRPGRRLWLCVYRPPEPGARSRVRDCGRGEGANLAEAVDRAASAVVGGAPGPDAVIKLDWELSREPATWPSGDRIHEAGVFGLAVGDATILPSEVLELGLFHDPDDDAEPAYDTERLIAILGERGAAVTEPFAFDRIRTASWVEPSAGAAPIRTYRVHAYELPVVDDPDRVLDRALWAAEALARTVDADGRIRYEYDTGTGKEKKGYNLLRHAGSSFALIQAYHRTGHAPWKDAAERALRYMVSKSKTDERTGPYGGGTVRYLVEGSHIKLGGAALALVALSTWQTATGDASFAGEAREFATYLVSQQQEDGEFVYFAAKEPGGAPRDDSSAYYPGEAVLGLVSWYALDPDPKWLQTAVRGADWLVGVRDAGRGRSKLDNDHWLLMALRDLHRVTGDDRYRIHALKIADAVAYQRQRQAGHELYHRDYVGGFYEPPRSTPAATRAEGLVAVLELGPGDLEREARIRELLLGTVQHMVQSQVTPETTWWMPRPAEVVGGFAGGIVDPDLRNDFTQHALSALLGTERILRDPRPIGPEELARRLAPLGPTIGPPAGG